MTKKRILAVRIIRSVDDCPDTSYLGEYSNTPDGEYTIDRAHSEDCASLEENHRTPIDLLERIIGHLDVIRTSPEVADNPDNTEWEALDEAINICTTLQDELQECDCNHRLCRNEYRYFNPCSENYKGCTPEEITKYCRQDYDQMESLNAGDWSYIGIRAEAEIAIPDKTCIGNDPHHIVQTIHSGGLWGVESNSDKSYLESIEADELSALRTQLKAIGFSTRAISTAFKNIEHKD